MWILKHAAEGHSVVVRGTPWEILGYSEGFQGNLQRAGRIGKETWRKEGK
jgi:hypothetical protein